MITLRDYQAEAFADFAILTDIDLATLIETEIARRGQAVAA